MGAAGSSVMSVSNEGAGGMVFWEDRFSCGVLSGFEGSTDAGRTVWGCTYFCDPDER